MANIKDYTLFLDVDGTITDGKFWYNSKRKKLKAFGPDDTDALRLLQEKGIHEIVFITGDTKGMPIAQKRIKDMGYDVYSAPTKPQERWKFLTNMNVDEKKIIFIGDGIYDYVSLRNADIGITTHKALKHVQESADVVINREGGDRFVAAAVLHLLDWFQIKWME